MRVFREWWMGEGSRAIELSHDFVLYFELDTKIHQFTVKRIQSFDGNFNRYNDRGDILFQVTKKKGVTIIQFFEMLESQGDPGKVENSFDNSSREVRKILRQTVDQGIEGNFELTRSKENRFMLREVENNFEEWKFLFWMNVEEIIEIHPGGEVLEDLEETFDKSSLRTDVEETFEYVPDKWKGENI